MVPQAQAQAGGRGSTRSVAVLFVTLFLVVAFAGCTSEPVREPTCEDQHRPGADETWLRVLVRRPINAAEAGFVRLWATPEAIGLQPAFTPDENQTIEDFYDELDGGRRDWLLAEDRWYEGMMPAGDYMHVRITVPQVTALRQDGAEPEVRVQFGRLTITHPDQNRDITLPGGQCFTILHEPILTQRNPGLYEITDQIE